LVKDWYYYYISYDELKKSLRTDFQHTPLVQQGQQKRNKPWSEEDERHFVDQLEQELDKVFTFQKVKSQEIIRRIKSSEKEVSEVIARADAAKTGDDRARQQAPTEEEFLLLEEDLSDIIADVHDLAKFTQLNYTGFQKIIKKHDKQTHWHLKPVFAARLNARPFFKDDYDVTVVDLSKLYDKVRTRGNPLMGDSAAGEKQQNFVRQTTKYWVHPDNITELKLIILKHLPVLVFNPSKEFEKKDSAISSIYYDNPDTWELYEGRLKKTEGAEAIRLRWYGGMDVDTIFVERKTHREDWTGEKSVKARFSTKEKNVNAFLRGDMTTAQIFEKMRRDGKKSEQEINDLEQLAKEVQFRVIDRKLVPVCRSFYNRTAFQLPGDARVRVSLDTELTMTREDNLDGKQRSGKNWRRMDIGIDFPFSQLPPEDVERFPYGVLEVKLQTAQGQEPPEWIRELTASHLVEAVPKFSKFIHGCATLFPNRIDLLPFWYPQMDVDIRKPVSHKFGIERPGQSADVSTSAAMDDDSDDDLPDDDRIVDVEEDETQQRLRAARDALEQHEQDRHLHSNGDEGLNVLDEEERMAHKPIVSIDDDYPIYDSDDEEEDLEGAKQKGGWAYRWMLAKRYSSIAGDKLLYALKTATPFPRPTVIPAREGRLGIPGGAGVSQKRFKAPKGKKIHVPVRVEPKVSFAAERTFLAWVSEPEKKSPPFPTNIWRHKLEFSIILGSIAATLLNFGDHVSLAAAIAFTVTAIAALFYSMAIFLWRVDRIKQRKAVNYHDKWGPSVLCIALLVCVGVAVSYRFAYGGDGDLRGRAAMVVDRVVGE
jgi:SPX domain protein involved in polyphosphate accumulation